MVKKQLPDWLNSSLWSSNPPPPPADVPSPSDHSPVDRKPVVPVTPPGAIEPPEPVKDEASDPLRDDAVSDHQDEFENGVSSASSAVEDASKQAQLLQEVAFTLCIDDWMCLFV